jgi:5-methylcytosine-specific restriction protein A
VANNPRWTDEELVLALELIDRRGWSGGNSATPDYIELSRVLRGANFPRFASADESFRSPNSVSMKLANLRGANPQASGGLKATRREMELVQQFLESPDVMRALAQTLRRDAGASGITTAVPVGELDDEEARVAIEGGPAHVLALRRERSRPLRRAKIRQAARLGQAIACEACAFDFQATYGDLGRSYIEVHHRTPLHVTGETASALDDLALLCANCHRMVHRRGWMSVESVADLVATYRNIGVLE